MNLTRLQVLLPVACVIAGIGAIIFAGIVGYSAVNHWKQYNKLKRSLMLSNESLKEEEFRKAWTNTVYTIVLVIVFAIVIAIAVWLFVTMPNRADFTSEVENIVQDNTQFLMKQ